MKKSGVIKIYDVNRGFGTLIESDNGEELYFYLSGVKEGAKIKEKTAVVFDIYYGKKGIVAVNIEVDE